jgi:hypothetical protein
LATRRRPRTRRRSAARPTRTDSRKVLTVDTPKRGRSRASAPISEVTVTGRDPTAGLRRRLPTLAPPERSLVTQKKNTRLYEVIRLLRTSGGDGVLESSVTHHSGPPSRCDSPPDALSTTRRVGTAPADTNRRPGVQSIRSPTSSGCLDPPLLSLPPRRDAAAAWSCHQRTYARAVQGCSWRLNPDAD